MGKDPAAPGDQGHVGRLQVDGVAPGQRPRQLEERELRPGALFQAGRGRHRKVDQVRGGREVVEVVVMAAEQLVVEVLLGVVLGVRAGVGRIPRQYYGGGRGRG